MLPRLFSREVAIKVAIFGVPGKGGEREEKERKRRVVKERERREREERASWRFQSRVAAEP